MTFELNQEMTINKVNIRKAGPKSARALMIDVRLTCVTTPYILAHFDPTLRHFMFAEEGGPRMRNLKPISWDGAIAHMELDIAGERFFDVTLHRFKFEALKTGHLAMIMVATIHPTSRQTAILADLADDDAIIAIQPIPELTGMTGEH